GGTGTGLSTPVRLRIWSRDHAREHVESLELSAVSAARRLELHVVCRSGGFELSWVRVLVARTLRHLRTIVAHCRGRRPEVTPSDLTCAPTWEEFEALLETAGIEHSGVEDVLPLAPM